MLGAGLVTLNLHVHFFYNVPLENGLTAVGLDCQVNPADLHLKLFDSHTAAFLLSL